MTLTEQDIPTLAAMLASYEADEPHWEEEKPYYPPVNVEIWADYLEEEHCGDCTNEPQPCVRCFAEELYHKARWLVKHVPQTPKGT